MKKEQDIQKKKKNFADGFIGKDPAALGRLAAAQRANLYTPGMAHSDVFAYWELLLKEYAEKYKEVRTESEFVRDCEEIKQKMNAKLLQYFQNGHNGFDDGFRFAHAQKSLSITLKHLWCREELSPNNPKYYPPVCPIDREILKKVGCYDAWTKVNFVEQVKGANTHGPYYKDHIRLVKDKAAKEGLSLPEWELFQWSD